MKFALAIATVFALLSLKQVEALKKTPTSLQIGTLRKNPDANCVKSRDGDELSVHYTGSIFETGDVFDSSVERDEPFDFTLGQGMVIAGWEQGLRGMCVGEKRIISFPSSLGYGDRGAGPKIPPNSALKFSVELVAINGETSPEQAHHEL